MAQKTIVFWRDIPAQIIVKEGRRSAKRELPERFVQAIDACAMRTGASETDAYLADWRRSAPEPVEGDIEAEAEAAVEALTSAYDQNRLKSLVQAGGHENG